MNNAFADYGCFNVKVEYDRVPIRHIAVQCPYCGKWFRAFDVLIGPNKLEYNSDVRQASFKCPVCSIVFGKVNLSTETANIIECTCAEDVYKDCLTKKVTWE